MSVSCCLVHLPHKDILSIEITRSRMTWPIFVYWGTGREGGKLEGRRGTRLLGYANLDYTRYDWGKPRRTWVTVGAPASDDWIRYFGWFMIGYFTTFISPNGGVRDSSVGIATRYGLQGPGIESRRAARFSAPVQTGYGAHPSSCTMGTGSFLGVKRPGRVADHPPPSSAEVEGRVELYICSPSGPSWPVLGGTLPFSSPNGILYGKKWLVCWEKLTGKII